MYKGEKLNMRTMMKQLIPENTSRKIDSLGRITIPKGLRDRMFLEEGSDLELFTAIIDGRQCICMASPIDEDQKLREAVAAFVECGVEVPEELPLLAFSKREDKQHDCQH